MSTFHINAQGFYGDFGGAFVPESLRSNIEELQSSYREIIKSADFQQEFRTLLRDYVGRPSPLYFAQRLSQRYGAKIYLKREDLNHTGAHKINNALGQILIARKMGKKHIVAETGAGQHGVATATVCALMGMQCTIFMGAVDVERQRINVERMRMLGAEVRPAQTGSRTLTDAVNEALAFWCSAPEDTFYLLGSAVGPHPYPDLVARLQSVISEEIRSQLLEKTGRDYPDYLMACIGGGSNAAGTIYHYLDDQRVKIVLGEGGGCGKNSGKTAATLSIGSPEVLHGSRTLVIKDETGHVAEPYSISAGLDYPGIGPMFAHLMQQHRIDVKAITDSEALKAAFELARLEGIIPALESSHALALLPHMHFSPNDLVVLTVSGRGDKDLETYLAHKAEID